LYHFSGGKQGVSFTIKRISSLFDKKAGWDAGYGVKCYSEKQKNPHSENRVGII
jgi:hypothetical protein